MTFDEWSEKYQPIKNNDGDSGLIIFAVKGLSRSDRFGSVAVILPQKPCAAAYGQKRTINGKSVPQTPLGRY